MNFMQKITDGVLVLIAVFIGAVFFQNLRGNYQLTQEMQLQQAKAASLIQEVGETKEESELLYQKLSEAQRELDRLKVVLSESAETRSRSAYVAPGSPRIVSGAPVARVPDDSLREAAISAPPGRTRPGVKSFLIVGQNHRLADSIMIAMVNEKQQKISLASIPRDLFVNGRKISEYLSLYGPETLREKISEVTGVSFEGYFILDFAAFKNIIDAFGGVDIHTERAVVDAQYPNGKGGYMLYALPAGAHHLSGEEALKFARSRHSTSDFDRAARQQKILLALRERIVNFDFLGNLDSVKELFEAIQDNIQTDLSFFRGVSFIVSVRHFQIESGNVLTTQNFLSSSVNMAGQYILQPRGGSWEQVREWVGGLAE